MEKKIAVSVIVPAYNAEQVVRNCVESIQRQTLKNLEIILVDDGSKDATREILETFAQSDQRIILIKKDQNEGLSAARNSALKIAKGEYVGFVDADDWVESDNFESMYRFGNGADLIISGYQHDTMDENRRKLNISRRVCMNAGFWNDKKELVTQAAYVDTGKMFAYTWNKLYKREIIDQNTLLFSKQVLIEDFIFNTEYWDRIQSLSIVDVTGYHYVKASKDALTQKFLPDFMEIMYLRYDYIRHLLEKNDVYEGRAKEELANVFIKHAIAGVVRNCSKVGNYSFSQQYAKVKDMLKNIHSKEAKTYAKGKSKQEKVCNFIFKTQNCLGVLLFGKIIYNMQTQSKTAFDKYK